jgi:hypothetical protein
MYGHTHSSDFVVSYSTPAQKTAETASSVSFVCGALTPLGRSVNPGFRVYEVDDATGELWDWKEYYTNITDPAFQQGPQWKVLYSAREAYAPLVPDYAVDEPLRPAFWHQVAEGLEKSLPAFRRFIYNKYRGSKFSQTRACRSDTCRKMTLCNLRRSRSEEKCGRIDPPTMLEDDDDDGIRDKPLIETEVIDEVSLETLDFGFQREAEEMQREFGFRQLLEGIGNRAKQGKVSYGRCAELLHADLADFPSFSVLVQLPNEKKALHASIMAKF